MAPTGLRLPRSPAVAVAFFLLGALAVVAVRSLPADPDARLPRRLRLAGLIEREQRENATLRGDADQLRRRLDTFQRDAATRQVGASEVDARLDRLELEAGRTSLTGPGLEVTLDDSSLERSPRGNVNDLVIHSQDVQAVVNALWRAGAEAVSINGQRLVSTSAVLCVGNTLLLNGTVHSPPYVVAAVGASEDRFESDRLVRRLRDDADAFGLGFSVAREDELDIPAFSGAGVPRHARPVTETGVPGELAGG